MTGLANGQIFNVTQGARLDAGECGNVTRAKGAKGGAADA